MVNPFSASHTSVVLPSRMVPLYDTVAWAPCLPIMGSLRPMGARRSSLLAEGGFLPVRWCGSGLSNAERALRLEDSQGSAQVPFAPPGFPGILGGCVVVV